jgi:hypothetical protein
MDGEHQIESSESRDSHEPTRPAIEDFAGGEMASSGSMPVPCSNSAEPNPLNNHWKTLSGPPVVVVQVSAPAAPLPVLGGRTLPLAG